MHTDVHKLNKEQIFLITFNTNQQSKRGRVLPTPNYEQNFESS